MSLARQWVEQARSLKARENGARRELVGGRPTFELLSGIEYASVDDDGRLEIYSHEHLDPPEALRFGRWLIRAYGESEDERLPAL